MSGMLRVKSLADIGKHVRVSGEKLPSKFNAQKVVIDGVTFDSKHEGERYQLLRMEERAGIVRNIRPHVPMQLVVNGQHLATFVVDFLFERLTDGQWQTEYCDAKGYRKGAAYQLFRLKKAILLATQGIHVEEV